MLQKARANVVSWYNVVNPTIKGLIILLTFCILRYKMCFSSELRSRVVLIFNWLAVIPKLWRIFNKCTIKYMSFSEELLLNNFFFVYAALIKMWVIQVRFFSAILKYISYKQKSVCTIFRVKYKYLIYRHFFAFLFLTKFKGAKKFACF